MTTTPDTTLTRPWRKSSRSTGGNDCVEVAQAGSELPDPRLKEPRRRPPRRQAAGMGRVHLWHQARRSRQNLGPCKLNAPR